MSFLKQKRSVDDIWPMYNKAVLVRVDFNVRVRNGAIAKSKGDQRIRAAIPTIRKIIDEGGKAILMSHMGRPTGHKFSALRTCDEKKRRYLQIWRDEAGAGCTTFFSLCSGEDKKNILSWSSISESANVIEETEGAGKTDLFATLSIEEKKSLLNRFQASDDRYCNFVFPHLRTYNGFDDELTLRPVAVRLSELLNESGSSPRVDVKFAEDCLNAEEMVASLEPGQVLLLENVRFYSDENSRKGSERRTMAQKIASYGDYFVSDGEHIY
jgi:phosphoglycerate kinase